MRNIKAFEFGFDRNDVSFASAPYGWSYKDDYDDWLWDDYYDDYYYDVDFGHRSLEFSHRIKNSNRDSIKHSLSFVTRNKNCRHLFQDIIAGNFCIAIEACTLLAEKYYIDSFDRYAEAFGEKHGFNLSLHEFDESSKYEYVNPVTDERFRMTKWACKFEEHIGAGENVTYDEVVEIIAHCVRIGRARVFY